MQNACAERLREVHNLWPLGRGRWWPSVQRVVEEVAYDKEVERCYPDEKVRRERWNAVEEVFNFAENYERKRKRKRAKLEGFLNELSLTADDTADAEDAQRRSAVTLMTLHASKGLEFPRVYLVGLEEGYLPHARAVREGGVEEERRLAYVGVTRAREALTLSYTAERAKYGQRVKSHPSRFLFEIKGTAPPEDWVPASEEGQEPPSRKKKKKKSKRKTRRRAPRASF